MAELKYVCAGNGKLEAFARAVEMRLNRGRTKGEFLDALMEILDKLLPYILECFPMGEMLAIEAAEVGRSKMRRLTYRARLECRAAGTKRPFFDGRDVADAIMDEAAETDGPLLVGCWNEYKKVPGVA
jgi:hypothetical protein